MNVLLKSKYKHSTAQCQLHTHTNKSTCVYLLMFSDSQQFQDRGGLRLTPFLNCALINHNHLIPRNTVLLLSNPVTA